MWPTVCALAATAVSAVGIGLSPTAAQADTGVSLPLKSYSQMVVDGSRGHLIFDDNVDGILVTDFEGHTLASIPEPGANSAVLSADNSTLYVALGTSHAVAVIDAATLTETARYDTGAHVAPMSVAFSGGKIWFGYDGLSDDESVGGNAGGLGSIDPSDGATSIAFDNLGYGTGLVASPTAPGVLAGAFNNGGKGILDVFDVSTGTARTTAHADTWPLGIVFTPDGKELITGLDGVLKVSDLTASGNYPTLQSYAHTATVTPYEVAPDGTVAFTTQRGIGDGIQHLISTSGPATGLLRTYVFGSDEWIADIGWDPDGSRLFVIDSYGGYHLQTLSEPERAETMLTGNPEPLHPGPGQPFQVMGAMGSGLQLEAGTVVQVARIDAAHPQGVALPDTPILFEGTLPTDDFAIPDTMSAAGSYTYRVTYHGDATHLGSSVDIPVVVARATDAMTLTVPKTAALGGTVQITGSLNHPPYTSGTAIQIVRKDLAHPGGTVLTAVAVRTDGTFGFTDTIQTGAATTYTAVSAGDPAHTSATASGTVQVPRSATSLTIATNASAYSYRASAKVTAHLGTTYNGRTVSIWAQTQGGVKVLVKSGVVDHSGNLGATYTLTGATTFTASFSGDYRYAPASAARTVHDGVSLAESLRGYFGSVRKDSTTYRTFHRTAQLALNVLVAPNKAGQCVRYTVQRYFSGGWHAFSGTGCVQLASGSNSALHLYPAKWPVGSLYRINATYEPSKGDTRNTTSSGSWQYLTVVG